MASQKKSRPGKLKPLPARTDTLRQRAEKMVGKKVKAVRKMPLEEMAKIIHELQVHQVELEMQNDELRRTPTSMTLPPSGISPSTDSEESWRRTLPAPGCWAPIDPS
jgi:hypothetical protein